MAALDEDIFADAKLAEGGDGIWSPPKPAPADAPRDYRSLYERELARAEAAETRCEELRWAEVAARTDAGSWKSRFKSCRRRLSEAEEETKELRRSVKEMPSLQAEVTYLRKLVGQATGPSEDGRVVSLRDEVARLRKVLAELETTKDTARPHSGGACRAQTPPAEARQLKATIRSLRTGNKRLGKELAGWRKAVGQCQKKMDDEKERAENIRATAKQLSRENMSFRREMRFLRDAETRARSLSYDVDGLRYSLKVSKAGKEKLRARIATLRAVGATTSKLAFDEAAHLRNVLRRSRRQKSTITRLRKENARLRRTVKAVKAGQKLGLRGFAPPARRSPGLRKENARLRKAVKGTRRRIETLEAELAKLRSTRATLSKRLYGRKSEQQDKPRSQRKRGQQRGAPGHGRTQRPGLDVRPEEIELPEEERVCGVCGQPYAPNGAEVSTLVEIEVIAYQRIISRQRWRRNCACASSPMEVSAPPVPRLFVRTPYGIGFWARFLFEHFACLRTLHGVAAWMSDHRLRVSPGTLADSLKRFVPLFEPLYEATLAHQNTAALRHADETSWRVQEFRGEDRSSRAWLWTSVSKDAVCFHIDPSRSAEAALKLFAEALPGTIIVCDRYSAYKRLVRLLGDKVILAYCWSHQRRDFIEAAAGQPRLEHWCQGWVGRIAEIYRLNRERLKHYDPGRKRQTAAFRTATRALKKAVDLLFAQAEAEQADLPDHAREARALRSLLNHREGLCVFVDKPQVPMDNNQAERILRGPAIGRGLSFGSDSEDGARLTAIMYSVVGTLSMSGIDVLRWLEAWLTACAENGRKPPEDLSPWLPWSMSEEHRRKFTAPG